MAGTPAEAPNARGPRIGAPAASHATVASRVGTVIGWYGLRRCAAAGGLVVATEFSPRAERVAGIRRAFGPPRRGPAGEPA